MSTNDELLAEAQVEAAAKALRADEGFMAEVHSALEVSWSEYIARLALVAAQGAAPLAPSEYAYCPIHGDLLAANRSYRCGNAPTGHEYAAPEQPSSAVDEAVLIREAKAEAWAEGFAAGRDYQGDGWNSDAHDPEDDNPYREGSET